MNISVVGGGYAGLASMTTLMKLTKPYSITIFDHLSVGKGGGSAVSSGIMHPFNPSGGVLWKGLESFMAAKLMMDDASLPADRPYKVLRLVRPLRSEKEMKGWLRTAENYPQWVQVHPNNNDGTFGTAHINNVVLVDSSRYLQMLWSHATDNAPRTVDWQQRVVVDLRQLSRSSDAVIVACGASADRLWSSGFCPADVDPALFYASENLALSPKLDVRLVRGQNMLYSVADGAATGPLLQEGTGLLCGQFVLPSLTHPHSLLCGATHVHIRASDHDLTDAPGAGADMHDAQHQLHAKLLTLLPGLSDMSATACPSAVRVQGRRSHLGRLPIVGRHPVLRNVWMIGAFGSRGLLHHAAAAEVLVRAIEADDESLIPPQMALNYTR